MKLPCRFCGQFFHDVNHGDSWTEPDGRHHWIVSPSGLLTGQRKAESVKKKSVAEDLTDPEDLEVTSMEDFIQVEPQPFDEIATEQEAMNDVQQQ
jgi:hypothetical protein